VAFFEKENHHPKTPGTGYVGGGLVSACGTCDAIARLSVVGSPSLHVD
jgi:hypothetical protein